MTKQGTVEKMPITPNALISFDNPPSWINYSNHYLFGEVNLDDILLFTHFIEKISEKLFREYSPLLFHLLFIIILQVESFLVLAIDAKKHQAIPRLCAHCRLGAKLQEKSDGTI